MNGKSIALWRKVELALVFTSILPFTIFFSSRRGEWRTRSRLCFAAIEPPSLDFGCCAGRRSPDPRGRRVGKRRASCRCIDVGSIWRRSRFRCFSHRSFREFEIVFLGTRFLLAPESLYSDAQREALVGASSEMSVRSMVQHLFCAVFFHFTRWSRPGIMLVELWIGPPVSMVAG